MPVPRLYDIALRLALAHAHLIRDVGDSPYPLCREILFTVGPEQLAQIELNSSHLHPETGQSRPVPMTPHLNRSHRGNMAQAVHLLVRAHQDLDRGPDDAA